MRENARVTLVHAAPTAGGRPPPPPRSPSQQIFRFCMRKFMRNLGHVLSDMAGGDQPDLSTQNRSDRVSNPIRAVPRPSGEHSITHRGARGSHRLGLHDRTEVRRLDADRPPGFVNTSSSSSTSSSVTVLDIRIASRCARGVRRELSRREQMLFTPSSTRRRQEVCAKAASW